MAWTPGRPFIGVTVETTVNGPKALHVFKQAVLSAIWKVFEGPILGDAKSMCPVGTDPIEPGSSRNRDSLGVVAWISPRGPMGKLFSESGHGGFVEVGTVHMSAQPYAWPALQVNIATLVLEMRQQIGSASMSRVMVTEERDIG